MENSGENSDGRSRLLGWGHGPNGWSPLPSHLTPIQCPHCGPNNLSKASSPSLTYLKVLNSPCCIIFRLKAKFLCMARQDPGSPACTGACLCSLRTPPPSSHTLCFSYVHHDCCTFPKHNFALALPSSWHAFLLLFSIVNFYSTLKSSFNVGFFSVGGVRWSFCVFSRPLWLPLPWDFLPAIVLAHLLTWLWAPWTSWLCLSESPESISPASGSW